MSDEALKIKLSNSPLIYRDKLTIPSNVNFGLELELDKVKYDEVYHLVKKQIGWTIKEDKSLTKDENAEIISPVLQNTKQTWVLIKKVGELLQKINPTYNNCSFQVNFDGSLLPSTKDKVNFLKLYAMYEDIIYKFSKGEDASYRDSLEMYAYPIILTLKGITKLEDESIVDMFSNNKRYGIVFKNKDKDLIEFRTPNMTSNTILWQNYVTTFYYLICLATSSKYDKKEVGCYIDNFYRIHVLEHYEIENKNKAIQFVKSIFQNDIDKYSFMHQYLGKENNKLIKKTN